MRPKPTQVRKFEYCAQGLAESEMRQAWHWIWVVGLTGQSDESLALQPFCCVEPEHLLCRPRPHVCYYISCEGRQVGQQLQRQANGKT